MKRRTQLPTRKLNQASINFIYLRLVTANNLCKVFQTSTKSKLGKSSWDGGATNLFPAAADAFCGPTCASPEPCPQWGCHQHTFSRQKSSQAPHLHCPLLPWEGFSHLAFPSLLTIPCCSVRGAGGAPVPSIWCWQPLHDRSWWLMSGLGANSCWFDSYCSIS